MSILTNQHHIDIRRHTGYGFFGSSGDVSLMYFRYFHHYNAIEYRMNNLQDEEAKVLINTYLPNLNALEMSTATADENLDTDKAAVWTHNRDEVSDRAALYTYYRKMLCAVLQVPPGPFFNIENSGSVRMFV